MPNYVKKSEQWEKLYLKHAPAKNHQKILEVLKVYVERSNIKDSSVRGVLVALTNPGLFPKRGAESPQGLYDAFMARHIDNERYPLNAVRALSAQERAEMKRAEIKGVKTYTLEVALYTQATKRDNRKVDLIEPVKKRRIRKTGDLVQFWRGSLTVRGSLTRVLDEQFEKMTRRGTKEFRLLYPWLMTDEDFRKREHDVPGYLDGVYILKVSPVNHANAQPRDPLEGPKRDGGNKVAIQYRYCSTTLDETQETFHEALRKANHRENECWINTLYDFYADSLMRASKAKCKIQRQDVLDVLGKTEENIKEGLTIQEILPFFEKYKLKLRVFDIFNNLVFKHDPAVPNFHNRPMFCVVEGDHVYTCNHDLESLAQKADDREYQVFANGNFRIPEKPKKANFRMMGHIDELLEVLRNPPPKEEEEKEGEERKIYFIHKEDDLEAVVWQLYFAGFRPAIQYMAGRICWVCISANGFTFLIKTQRLVEYEIEGSTAVDEAAVFNRMHDARAEFHYQLFRSEHKSYYSPLDVEVLNECRTVANVGFLRRLVEVCRSRSCRPPPISRDSLAEIDITKAYTGAFMRIQFVPIFNEFDVWKKYKPEEPLRNHSLYVVEVGSFDLFFNRRYNLCYGSFLKDAKEKKSNSFLIHMVKHPSLVKRVNYQRLVEDLWKTSISEHHEEDVILKKTILNTNFGMLEKQVNRNQRSKLFDSYEEALFFQKKYGGTITFIQQYEDVKGEHEVSQLDKDVDEAEPTEPKGCRPTGTKRLYILNLSAQAELSNGFRYIKELLMQHHNFYLNKCWRLLEDDNIRVFTVKTDAFTIKKSQVDQAQELLSWNEGIGTWRLSKTAEIKFPSNEACLLTAIQNKLLTPVEFESTNIPLTKEDEYDTDKLCGLLEQHRRVMIRAEFPGCGKSYCCEAMRSRGHKVLFVCPTNKLASDYGEHGCTVNRFFGIGLTEDSKMARFDDSDYDTIVFDEILLCCVRKLSRIKHYCESHPEKIVVATGDTSQLKCIEPITNQHDYHEYYNHCVDMIFATNLFFREIKRLKDKESKEKLMCFKRDIFDEDIPKEQTIRKYFPLVRTLKTTRNIAYRNSTCSWASQLVRSEILRKTSPYEVGEVLVCRKYLKIKKQVFNVNYEYTISSVDEDSLLLNDSLRVPLATVARNFVHNYCRTCHSFQGSTIDDAITVFDWQFVHVDRNWIYTAVTRSTDLKKVYFYDYDEEEMKEGEMLTYFRSKVAHYKTQDRRAKRLIRDEDYVSPEWLREQVGKACKSCGDCLVYSKSHGKVECNITAQRLNNNDAHHLDNICGYCVDCNTSMSSRE